MNNNKALDDDMDSQDIAIIGMAAHLPGASNVEQYWSNLREGVESIQHYSDEQLIEAGVSASRLKDSSYVKAGAPLTDMEMFDASFFGFSPKEGMILDPQHRHFMECSWEALENSGYDPSRFNGAIGVFGGSGHNTYLPYNLLTNPEFSQSVGFFLLRHTGNDKDFLTTRVSYIFNLRGPSVAVQSACSTSLVAIHMACQSILNGESDMALAGGSTIELPHRHGYTYKEGEILSPDGHCRAFDAKSKGTVFGSGAGIVVLKRLDDALADGDTVHAVIKGSAINNDGSLKMGYFAPSVEGQAAAVDEAVSIAEIDPSTITYIETHGTGTPVGDPIEVSALTQAYRRYTEDKQFCALASAKTNIGHLDTAAGVAGLIKVVESLKHRQIPASLHYEQPNPTIDFDNSPFYVNNVLKDWQRTGDEPRRAAINSLGVGGTNAHAILEEAPERKPSSESRPLQLLVLSAKTQSALDQSTNNLAEHLKKNRDVNLADIAHTLRVGRKFFSQRRILVCGNHDDAIEALETKDPKRVLSFSGQDVKPTIAFMFTGQGSQYAGMGRDLYDSEPIYKKQVDQCVDILKHHIGFDLRDVLFPSSDKMIEANQHLQKTSITQPALFVTEYALAMLWNSWGVNANAMIGHSIGEYVAACLAGVFSLEDALSLVAARGRLMEGMAEGDMMAVPLPEDKVTPLLGEKLSLAAVNADGFCVVSGEANAIETLRSQIETDELSCRKLHTSHAFHSSMMEPMLEEFTQRLSAITLSTPEKPFVSNVTGTWITPEEATSPDYWAKHLRGTVRFSAGLSCLLEDSERLLLEVGPGNTLVTFARQNSSKQASQTILNSMRHPREDGSDTVFILNTLGRLMMAGMPFDHEAFSGNEVRYRVPLPTYPFEKQHLWVEPGAGGLSGDSIASSTDKLDIDEWFYQPTWRQTSSLVPSTLISDQQAQTLLFLGTDDFGATLEKSLKNNGVNVISITTASQFTESADDMYQINPESPKDFERLFDSVSKQGAIARVINLWNLSSHGFAPDKLDDSLNNSFYHLVTMIQELGKLEPKEPIRCLMLSEGMQQVAGEILTAPELAPIQGVCKVANSEFPSLDCSSLDVQLKNMPPARLKNLADALVLEATQTSEHKIIAYRGDRRFIQTFEKAPLQKTNKNRIKQNGVYLITGGLGGLGLSLAEHLVKTANAKIALLSRRELPPISEWDKWLDRHALTNSTSEQIRKVQRLKELGCEPLLLSADVTNLSQMQTVVTKITETLGSINGVFHTAGMLNDGLIPLKTKSVLAPVLAPKIQGTVVLDQIFSESKLDFCVLYSSVSSISGAVGQIDYTAANAFLNAFSHYRYDQGGTPMIAVNWGAWQQVGMAAKLAENMGITEGQCKPFDHPFYTRYCALASEVDEFRVELSTETHWVLDQHRTKAGVPLVPGTGYLEFARAAYDAYGHSVPIEISSVLFISPFALQDDETKTLCVKLEYDGVQADFTVLSRGGEGAQAWSEEHVQGSINPINTGNAQTTVNIANILERCNKAHEHLKGTAEHPHLAFGERWKNIDDIHFGDAEAVITMSLPEEFSDDFKLFSLHPAMLDSATGAAQALIPGFDPKRDFLVPISYSKVRIFSALEPNMYSHVRYFSDPDNDDIAYFDVTITDRLGRVLMDIERFTMKQVDHSALASIGEKPSHVNTNNASITDNQANTAFAESMAVGLLPEEGFEALDRILNAQNLPQIIVSTVDFDAFLAASNEANTGIISDADADEELGSGIDRPNIPTEYLAPESDIEKTIAKVWQAALGINKVGVNDNFFELGGHSLLLTQIVARSRKQLKRELPLSDVFELPTIAEWAAILDKDTGEQSSVPDVIAIDRTQYRMTRAALAAVAGY